MNLHVNSRSLGFNVNSENVLLPAKNTVNLVETPRKIPFKDATNKASELLRSALKPMNFQTPQQPECSPLKAERKKEAIVKLDPFVFPTDKNCYCCGDNRKTDGEIWGEKLVLNEEFMEQLMSNFGPIKDNFMESSPPSSPFKLQRINIETPEMSPINSFVDASYAAVPDFSFFSYSDSDSELEVPADFDIDFSLESDVETKIADGSIIQSW